MPHPIKVGQQDVFGHLGEPKGGKYSGIKPLFDHYRTWKSGSREIHMGSYGDFTQILGKSMGCGGPSRITNIGSPISKIIKNI